MKKRYQVFVSSTYEDLRRERQAIIESLLKIKVIPVGMEHFTASSKKQWDVIKPLIEDSDYYVVVIAGRYGSIAENGISYTEKEYDYAIKKEIPVIAFIYNDVGSLQSKHVDNDQSALDNFKNKIKSNATIEHWSDSTKLQGDILASITNEIRINPRPGWSRCTKKEDNDLQDRIVRLENENEKLRKQNNGLNLENYENHPFLPTLIHKEDFGKCDPIMYCPKCLQKDKIKISIPAPTGFDYEIICPANCGWKVQNPNYRAPSHPEFARNDYDPFT